MYLTPNFTSKKMMKAKIGVLVIHGAGGATFTRQEKFIDKLQKYLEKQGIDNSAIAFKHINWYHPTESNQQKIWDRLTDSGYRLKSNFLRKFIMFLVGDMVAYTGIPNRASDTYRKTHEIIFQHIREIQKKVPPQAPLVILSSSLGTSLITDYIWDRQKENDPVMGDTPFEKLDTLTGLFLLGNNIPLYAAAYDPDQMEPVIFPPKNLDKKFLPFARFVNIFDRHDPLGFPLKPLNSKFDAVISNDIEMNVGSIFTSWNIGSHLAYWKSRRIRKLIGDYLIGLVKAI